MWLCRRTALWAGCVILVLVFLAAEELADATSPAQATATPIAELYIDKDGSYWEESADDLDNGEVELQPDALSNAEEVVVAPVADAVPESALDVGYGGPTLRIAQEKPAHKQAAPPARTVSRVCRVTAYCDRGLTAAGVRSGVGQCAAPIDIPLGSTVYIPALHRKFVVTDRTHRRFRHNTVDLFIPSQAQCRHFGRRYLECEFTLAKEPAAYGELRVAQVR